MVAGLSEQQSCLLFKAKIVAIHTCLLYIHLIQSLYMHKSKYFVFVSYYSSGLENFRGVSALKKCQPNLKWRPKKVIITSLSHFSLTAASLAFCTAPKPTDMH